MSFSGSVAAKRKHQQHHSKNTWCNFYFSNNIESVMLNSRLHIHLIILIHTDDNVILMQSTFFKRKLPSFIHCPLLWMRIWVKDLIPHSELEEEPETSAPFSRILSQESVFNQELILNQILSLRINCVLIPKEFKPCSLIIVDSVR